MEEILDGYFSTEPLKENLVLMAAAKSSEVGRGKQGKENGFFKL